MGIFKTIQEDFWSIVKSHTWNAQQAEYFSFHNDVVNQFFSCLLVSLFFLKLCTYVMKSCFLRYPKGCEQPRGVYKVAQCRIVNVCVLCPHLIHLSGLVLPGPSFPSWTTLPDWCPPEVSWCSYHSPPMMKTGKFLVCSDGQRLYSELPISVTTCWLLFLVAIGTLGLEASPVNVTK